MIVQVLYAFVQFVNAVLRRGYPRNCVNISAEKIFGGVLDMAYGGALCFSE